MRNSRTCCGFGNSGSVLRIWKQGFRAAELGTAHFELIQRVYAAEVEDLLRMQRVRAAEPEVLGDNHNVAMMKVVSCDLVFEADQDQGSQAIQADQTAEISAVSHAVAKDRGLRRRRRRKDQASKMNQADKALPATVVVLRVADEPDAHADSGSRFIFRLWMHVVGDIAACVPESELSPFNRVMALVGTAGPAGFMENELGSIFAFPAGVRFA